MVNYGNADVAAMRRAAAAERAKALQGTVTTKGGTFGIGRGVAKGNVKGFDLDEYRRQVEAGASGTALKQKATGNLYRTQPEVADLIQKLSNKQDVTALPVSSMHDDNYVQPVIVNSPRSARDAILTTTDNPDHTAVLKELRPVSGQGLINDRTPSLAPIPHPSFETQGHDDLVSNLYAPTATPDEHHEFAPYQDNSAYQTQEESTQEIIDESISYDDSYQDDGY